MIATHQLRKFALEALTTERTARRAYAKPNEVRDSTLVRLTRSATYLGLPPAPDKKSCVSDTSEESPHQSERLRLECA